MAYTPVATDAAQPVGSVKASTAAAEFRAIKAYLNGIVAAGLPAMASHEGDSLTVSGGVAVWSPVRNLYDFVTFI